MPAARCVSDRLTRPVSCRLHSTLEWGLASSELSSASLSQSSHSAQEHERSTTTITKPTWPSRRGSHQKPNENIHLQSWSGDSVALVQVNLVSGVLAAVICGKVTLHNNDTNVNLSSSNIPPLTSNTSCSSVWFWTTTTTFLKWCYSSLTARVTSHVGCVRHENALQWLETTPFKNMFTYFAAALEESCGVFHRASAL